MASNNTTKDTTLTGGANIAKLMKKYSLFIFPIISIVMILAAVTVSFAWFTQNTHVDANFLEIRAKEMAIINLISGPTTNDSEPYMGQAGISQGIIIEGVDMDLPYYATFKNIGIRTPNNVSLYRYLELNFEIMTSTLRSLNTQGATYTLAPDYNTYLYNVREGIPSVYNATPTDILENYVVYVYEENEEGEIGETPVFASNSSEYHCRIMLKDTTINYTIKIRFWGGGDTPFKFYDNENIGATFTFTLGIWGDVKDYVAD